MSILRQIWDTFGQKEVSEQRRMPVDDMSTATLEPVTAEPVTPKYYDVNGVLQTDAGQVAGTIIVLNLDNKNIMNSLGDVVGMYGDTSVSFGAQTALVATHAMPFRGQYAENAERDGYGKLLAGKARAIAVTQGFRNGDYTIDHEHGVVYIKKATSGICDTVTYSVLVQVAGGSSTLPSSVNVAKIGGTAVGPGLSGSTTASAPSSVSVGVASALAVAANASRKGLVLTNLLSNTGRISLSLVAASPAVDLSGIVLYPGDSFVMDPLTFTLSQINAISNVAAQTLAIQELI